MTRQLLLLYLIFFVCLKSDSHPPKKIFFICFNESPLKMVKNAFYFILKGLFVLKMFKCLFWLFWSCRKNGLIRNIRLISKFMTSQLGQQTIKIHILPSISRSKSNQTLKFGQSIEYNKRNFFFKNHAQNMAERLVPDLFFFFKKAL